MAKPKFLETGLVLLLVLGRLTCAEPFRVPLSIICLPQSVADSVLGIRDSICPLNRVESFGLGGVIEGSEVALLRALNMVHTNSHEYAAVLFYASWCPFSATFRPTFSIMSSLYHSIPHFAVEESAIRPSMLSKYGVHGFPTLFLLNSTMRVRYHGSRSLSSVTAFYNDVTGITGASMNITCPTRSENSGNDEINSSDLESCPFTWARSPEKLLRQETYLALATIFVLLRLVYVIVPGLRFCAQFACRRHILNVRFKSLWELPLAYLNRAIQLFSSLKEPCKRSNLQGAMNAKVWASKSLATVSFGEASTSRVVCQ